MAFTDLGSIGATGATTNNQASLALTTTAACSAGELVVVAVADDNRLSGADADGSEVSGVADSGGNTWTKALGWANNEGGTQLGSSISLWYSVLTNAIANGGTITASFTSATLSDATALTARHFSYSGGSLAVEATNSISSDDSTDPLSLNATTANIECLRIRAIGIEAISEDLVATTNWTAWDSGNSAASGGGIEICVRVEHRISTGTGDASSPPPASWEPAGSSASVYVAFKVVPSLVFNPAPLQHLLVR